MPQQITVRVEIGPYAILGRDVDWVEVNQGVGDHALCTVSFDRDPRANTAIAGVQVGDLADASVRVVLLDAAGAGAAAEGGCLAFAGRVREVRVAHQPAGGARFTVSAVSDSYALAAHADRRYLREQTLGTLASTLGIAVAGALPDGEPRDYVQRGESDWALLARAAAVEGVQLRPVWGRAPEDEAPSEPAELGTGFTEVTHALTWGRDLIAFETVLKPTNPGVTGAFYDPAAKHDHRFRGVRQKAKSLGGAKPLWEAAERVATQDAGGGDPGHVEVGGPGGGRARTLEEFRTRLERASTARAGSAVEATGTSTQPALRAGDRITVGDGSPQGDAGAGAAGAGGADAPAGDTGAAAGGEDGTVTGGSAPGGDAPSLTPWGADVGAAERGGTYGLVRVTHRWTGTQYENEFTATPWADYHPAPPAVERQLAARAALEPDAAGSDAPGAGGAGSIDGLQLAIVTANNDPKGRGRVKVRYAWMDEGESTAWIRVAGLGGGNGHGLGVLPEVGHEVVVAAVGGDAEHPVVLGTLWNGTDKAGHSPGRQSWKSRSGSMIHMSEGRAAGQQKLEMHTPGGTAMVRLNADGPTVTIYSAKDISIEAPNGEVRIHAKTMATFVDADAYREVKGKSDEKVVGNKSSVCEAALGIKGKSVVLRSDTTLETHATGALTTSTDATMRVHAAGALTTTTDATVLTQASGEQRLVGAPVAINP